MCAQAAQAPRQRQTRGEEERFEYDAFISYAHDDRPVAAGIQKGLHRIGRRMGQLHALRVFRDATDLIASPDLWGRVTEEMGRARYLIVVLSPHSVASGWVNKEVTHWLERHGPDRLLFVVTDGHLIWDEASGRFDPDRSDVALPVLTQPGILAAEPFYVDVTEDAPWDPASPMFREKITDLAAPIHGKPKYELAGEDLREQRRFRRLRRAAITGLVLLTVLAVAAATLAFVQRQESIRQRNQAIAVRLVSEAQSMLAGARPGGDARALKQILAAQSIGAEPEQAALLDAVLARKELLDIAETTAAGVKDIALSSDERRIVTGGVDGTVRLWEADTGKPIDAPMTGNQGEVVIVRFSPDGRRIASGGATTVRVWDADTGAPLGTPMTVALGEVSSVEFSPDGRRIVIGSSEVTSSGLVNRGAVQVWDANTGAPIGAPMTEHDGMVVSVAFAPDGRRLVVGSGGPVHGAVRVWDADTGAPIGAPMTEHDGMVVSVAFAQDGQRIVSGGADGTVRLWNADIEAPIGEPMTGHAGAVASVAFAPDGARIVSGGADGTVRLWDADTKEPIGEPLTGHESWVLFVTFSPDGQRVISGGGDEGTVRVWDVEIGSAGQGSVMSVAFAPDGRRFVSAGADGTLKLWDADTGSPIGELTAEQGVVMSVSFSPDGRRIVSGTFAPASDGTTAQSGTVQLWDADTRQPIGEPMTGHQGHVFSVAFAPNGLRIASGGSDGTIRLWDADTRQPIGEPMTGHRDAVVSVAFAPDGRRIASGGSDGTIRLWNPDTRQPIGEPMTGHQGEVTTVAFAPDGQRIVSSGLDGTIRLWDPETRQPVGEPLNGQAGPLASVAFAPDSRRIAYAGYDRSVRLWDADTGMPIGPPMSGHTDAVRSVAFSPDGGSVVSGGVDGQIWQWAITPADWTATLCGKLTMNMSHRQWREWVSPDIDYVELCPGLPIPADDTPPGN
ncbi:MULTISPECIES: TIR domain-containing protein [Rhodococcus]|nr:MULTISPECIES: TIR domain-containing protein [Rhodococcus]MDV7243576.1 TIR domain-containing protein [Rhodococcus oxybenzonivorans]MDV7277552.1 TIR domain-containing protein [Rhodococcus oxybenzonivorans]MDV7335420.1 TIR domain-containing protein [Rhodococcus oxybenzonivorans]MDV7347264.1 TIR domain-containing protein [Rhodococcus oxybenzonivorans]MDV8028677.1 TIR domain-containing protein [Rhodococcus sp. IEGM 27]